MLFQPHLYSRTLHLAHGFAEALAGADAACVTEIYPAREEPVPGVSGRLIVDELAEIRPGMRIGWAPSLEDAAQVVAGWARAGRHRAHARCRRRRPRGSADPRGARVKIEDGVALARFTTLGTGGPARAFARPESEAEVEELLRWARERSLAVAVVGLGSNLLAADDGVDALVLKLGGELATVEVGEDLLRAGGGAANAVCLHRARAAGLGGFEFACAIPGTIGGGVWMNGGAYGGDFAGVLERALVATAEGSGWLTPARARAELSPLRAPRTARSCFAPSCGCGRDRRRRSRRRCAS